MLVDLNGDLGESFGAWTLGDDDAMMQSVSSANIACGFHAGDPSVMRRTLRLARARGVSIGAHPSFPDLAGFGRREMRLDPDDIENLVLYQTGALAGLAAAEGLRLSHVKPHGALYTMAARDRAMADAIARAVARADAGLVLFGPPGSSLAAAAESAGLAFAREAFADRAYEPDGRLRSRALPDALITDHNAVCERVVRLVEERTVVAVDGTRLTLEADTICVHGDSPGAAALARRVREALERYEIIVAAPRRR